MRKPKQTATENTESRPIHLLTPNEGEVLRAHYRLPLPLKPDKTYWTHHWDISER